MERIRFRPREFVERNFERNFYGREEPDVIFDGNKFEAKKREMNRERIARQQGIPMLSVGRFNEHIGLQEGVDSNIIIINKHRKRGTRGKGRKINYKQP